MLAEDEQWAKLRDDRGDRRRGMGKRMKRTKPPFRADHVGSLLRPAALKDARAKRAKGEISAARPQGRGRPRDRARHHEAGRGRPAGGHRRRIPPLLVASRFPLGPRRRRAARDGARASPSRRVKTRAEGIKVTGKVGYSGHPMIEHYKFVRGSHQGHAEDHHSGAVRDLRPPDGDADRQDDLSGPRRVLPRCRPGLPQGGARLRGRRLPLSAARRSVHRDAVRREIPPADARSRRRSGKARRNLRRPDQRRDVGHSRPT